MLTFFQIFDILEFQSKVHVYCINIDEENFKKLSEAWQITSSQKL